MSDIIFRVPLQQMLRALLKMGLSKRQILSEGGTFEMLVESYVPCSCQIVEGTFILSCWRNDEEAIWWKLRYL